MLASSDSDLLRCDNTHSTAAVLGYQSKTPKATMCEGANSSLHGRIDPNVRDQLQASKRAQNQFFLELCLQAVLRERKCTVMTCRYLWEEGICCKPRKLLSCMLLVKESQDLCSKQLQPAGVFVISHHTGSLAFGFSMKRHKPQII